MSVFITRFDTRPGRAGGGVRVAVKDLIDVAGAPTTDGSKVIAAAARPAERDAACLAGTRAAQNEGRAVIVGKTNMHELAFGVTGINPWFGTPLNPLDASRVPGGSSSGSAVAVALCEADVAFGSDTGGSIRIPAACCGVAGLKTTRGRVPLDGVIPLAPSLDTIGPLARTVAGLVDGMALLEPGFSAAAKPARRVGRVRLPAESRIDEALDAALHAAGLVVVGVLLPGWDAATAAAMTILSAEAWRVHGDLYRSHAGDLSPDVAARLSAASAVTEAEVAAARHQAAAWDRELRAVLAGVDVLVLPTLAREPPPLSDPAAMSKLRYTAPFNLAGVPALSIPVPVGGGLPAGLQIVGPAGSEALLLATAAEVEAAAGSY